MENVVFLADHDSNALGFAQKIKSYIKDKNKIDVPLLEVEFHKFKNKEILPRSLNLLRQKDVYFIHDSSKDPSEWWVELLLQKDMILNASANSLTFVLPNMLYSRQDRKDRPRVPISARALANSISPGLKRIITMDLHTPTIQGFYPANVPLDNLYSSLELIPYLIKNNPNDLENLVVVSPDTGGVTRCKAFLNKLNKFQKQISPPAIAFIYKIRDDAGDVKSMNLVGEVKGKNVLIIDDIIDSGGTLFRASQLLRDYGAKKLLCYGTHGLFTENPTRLIESFDVLMTSNTCYNKEDGKIKVIDVTPTFAESIYRVQQGGSLSELFD